MGPTGYTDLTYDNTLTTKCGYKHTQREMDFETFPPSKENAACKLNIT